MCLCQLELFAYTGRNVAAVTLVSGNMWFVRTLAGIPPGKGTSNESGVVEIGDFFVLSVAISSKLQR